MAKEIKIGDARIRSFNGTGTVHPSRLLVVELPLGDQTDRALKDLSKAQREKTPVSISIGVPGRGEDASS